MSWRSLGEMIFLTGKWLSSGLGVIASKVSVEIRSKQYETPYLFFPNHEIAM